MNAAFKLTMVAFLGASVVVACGDDDDTTSTTSTTTTSTATTTGTGGTGGGTGGGGEGGMGNNFPPIPTLGTQIDRKGRPAVNTALNRTFAEPGVHGAAEDSWNSNSDPSTWAGAYMMDVAADLAIYDALDGTCGNQLVSCDDETAGCYDTLATALVNDWLLVKGDATEGCSQYLAVEANAVMAIVNDQCGGRTPAMDVIETTYSALAIGNVVGVDDTITAPPQANIEVFPYLADANN